MSQLASPLRFLGVLLTAALLLASPASAQDAARTLNETVALDADGEVVIDNHEGSITIDTWDRAEVRYEVRIMPTDDDPTAEKTSIDIERSGSRLSLATTHEDGDDESKVFGFSFDDGFRWGGTDIPDVHYTLTMPATARLTIDDHESVIDVTGLRAALRIDTHDGPIRIADHDGDTRIDSHDGDIELSASRGPLVIDTHDSFIALTDHDGDVTIESHESEMDLRGIAGYLVVDTHDGELTAEDLRGGFRFEAHDGEADVSIAELSDDIHVDTHDADITLRLAPGAAFALRTDFDDDVDLDSDFDLSSIRIADEDDDEVNYRGDVNGGGPRIYLAADDGDFDLRIR